MTITKKPLFWPVTGRDFARSLAWARTEINPIAIKIREYANNTRKNNKP